MKQCPEFIRHKTTVFYPGLIVENGIGMTKSVHNEGEFMISRCAGYHAGFNFGFNIAEAVNFALTDWLKIANSVKSCHCVADSVRFNMGCFFQNINTS
jgi:DNA damage-responsive transcriptional repressor / [histone H3]-trimethyl-L-lysine36 demethylase